jgi:hypothetical protein
VYVLLTLFVNKQIEAQTTFYVTDPVLGNSNSLDNVLIQAITSANLGNNVTVLFKCPSLCEIDEVLPLLEISNGSLTLIRDPYTSIPQGINRSTYNNPNIVNGFFIKNTNPLTSIIIDGLDIKNFATDCIGLNIDESNNVTIKNCTLVNTEVAIQYDNSSSNLLIEHNTFNNNDVSILLAGVKCLDYNSTGAIRNSVIKNNIINSPPSSSASIACERIPTIGNRYFKHKLLIEENHITGSSFFGISISSGMGYGLFEDFSYDVTLNNNDINSITGLLLDGPLKQFVIKSNRFSSSLQDVQINGVINNNYAQNSYGIDFVGINSFGIPTVNGTNFFSTANAKNSFIIFGDLGKGVSIIGNTLPKRVVVSDGRYTHIRQNKILSSQNIDSPISLIQNKGQRYGNENIAAPSNVTLFSNGNILTVKYNLSGTQITQPNADFIVDFYKSNANGDLLDYIGNQTISTLTSGEFTAQFTITSNNPVERIATTVTAYGGNLDPIGTSQASYSITPNCHCENLDFCFSTATGCVGTEISISDPSTSMVCPRGVSSNYCFNYGDGSANTTLLTHNYATAGNYTVMMIFPATNECLADTIKKNYVVSTCYHNCIDCIGSFSPVPDSNYVLSAWVMEENAPAQKTSYTYPSIKITFVGTSQPTSQIFVPEGIIIDGWQRIEKPFHIPIDATSIKIELLSSSEDNCFFDDIRIFPIDGTMKSYVYDPITLRLVAELDENNYATFYEYDEEGKLVRVKKETVKGVMTIKENKNSSVKRN